MRIEQEVNVEQVRIEQQIEVETAPPVTQRKRGRPPGTGKNKIGNQPLLDDRIVRRLGRQTKNKAK